MQVEMEIGVEDRGWSVMWKVRLVILSVDWELRIGNLPWAN